MSDMDNLIRARARGTLDGNANGADFDAALRVMTGHGPAPALQQQGNDQATEQQLAMARASGIPDSAAHYLRGDSTEALRADAAVLNRAAAASGGWQDAPTGSGFDGGARGGSSTAAPGMEQQIRTALNNLYINR